MELEQLIDSINESNLTNEELSTSISIVQSTTERIAKIINGLRFFARDGSQLPKEKVNLDTIIENTMSFCSEQMRLHDVEVEIIKNYNTDLIVDCRAVEISQVLLNLLNNSNDAISLQTERWIKLVITDHDKDIEINVIDSGPGITPDIQDKIMQPFFTTKVLGRGTGLGLSISHGIIESHQGRFFIDNSFQNTKFTIIIPKRDSEV